MNPRREAVHRPLSPRSISPVRQHISQVSMDQHYNSLLRPVT